jgi:DNA repair photolyase
LDVYGCGCAHDCSYCYAKILLDFRGLWNPAEPSAADMDKVERKISKLKKCEIVRLGGMTDCFQPIENQVKNTYRTINLLNKYGIGYLIVTKSDLIAEYQYILDPELAHIQISVTSIDPVSYEHAASPQDRIRAILSLQRHYDTAIRISPLIIGKIDLNELNGYGINKAVVEFLRVNTWVKRWMPNLDFSQYTLKSGGYWHLPLETKIKALDQLKIPYTVC